MDRDELIKKLNDANISSTVDGAYRDSILEASMDAYKDDKFRGQTNLIIAMEEASEFIKEVSKKLRGEESNLGLMEEIVDVLFAIRYAQLIYGISDEDINKTMNIKLDRRANKIGYNK